MRMGIGIGLGFQRRSGASVPPAAATLSGLSYAADLISVTTDTASGTIYYLLHNSVTPLSGAAIKSAVVGLTAVGGGTLDPLETDNQVTDWTAVTPDTYWINMVQETTGGFSNVVSLEATVIAASFDPASLPGAEIVVDISDMTTLWQDTAGSTQITASGQTVGSVTNRGTLGGLFVNTGGTDEPTYTEAGGLKYLAFDGSNDFLTLDRGVGSAFTMSGGFWLWVLAFDDGTGTSFTESFLSIAPQGATSVNNVNGVVVQSREASTNLVAVKIVAGANNTGGIQEQLRDTRTTDLPWSIVEFECIPTAADPNYWMRVEQVGDSGVPVAIGSGGTTGTGFPDQATTAKRMTLGANMNGGGGALAGFFKGRIAAVVMVSGALSTSDRDDVRAWLRTRAAF